MYTEAVVEEYIKAYREVKDVKYIGVAQTDKPNAQGFRDTIILVGNDTLINAKIIANGNQTVGTCAIGFKGDELRVQAIKVADQHRNNGIGSAIIGLANDIARANDKEMMTVSSLPSALPFYISQDFKLDTTESNNQGIFCLCRSVYEQPQTSRFETVSCDQTKTCPFATMTTNLNQ